MERRVFDKAKVDDLVLLNNISEDEILGTLRRRFESDLIYTTIGRAPCQEQRGPPRFPPGFGLLE